MSNYVALEFDENTKRILKGIPQKDVLDAVRFASRKPLNRVVKDAKKRVPVRYGFLKDALETKIKYYPRKGRVWTGVGVDSKSMQVSVNGGKNTRVRPVWYAHLVEFGHKFKNGTKAKAQPFFRPAVNALGDNGNRIYTDALNKKLLKILVPKPVKK